PSFRAKNFSTCTRSPTARGSAHASHYAMGDVAFSSAERDRHLGSRPVSQLDTWPVVAPVNASRRPSRDAAHHSGSGRLARPSPWGTCTSYSLPANWRTLLMAQPCRSATSALTESFGEIADSFCCLGACRDCPFWEPAWFRRSVVV